MIIFLWQDANITTITAMSLMYQSFVTTAPMGPGNSGDNDFLLYEARVYVQHRGDIFLIKVMRKVQIKSRQENVKLYWPVLD